MSLEDIKKIEDQTKQVAAIYEVFEENSRLNYSKAARVEFLTTMHYIEKYLTPGSKILDIGAGAGEYSLHLAKMGYEVTAVELAPRNLKAFEAKIEEDLPLTLYEGNALDLSRFEGETFDVTLMLGPLYHLYKEEDRIKAVKEALKVTKKEGILFFAFISNDMVILTEFSRRPDFFEDTSYDHDTFKVKDFPFVFATVSEARRLLKATGIQLLHEVASDGVSELMAANINALNDKDYRQFLRYHLYCCEKPEMLGRSNHLLFIGKNRT